MRLSASAVNSQYGIYQRHYKCAKMQQEYHTEMFRPASRAFAARVLSSAAFVDSALTRP